MSVINQMLRDLDRRGQVRGGSGLAHALPQGARSVFEPVPRTVHANRASGRKPWALLLGAGSLVAIAASAAWYLGFPVPSGVPELAPLAKPAPAAVLTVSAAASFPTLPESGVARSAVATDLPVSLRLDAQLEHAPALVPEPAPAAPLSAGVKPRPAALPARIEADPPQSHAAPKVPDSKQEKPLPTSIAAAPPVLDAAQQAQRQGAAAREALAQAQSLWSAGNPTAATELLREAVQVALRSTSATAPLDGTQAVMVRELARMQMGSGQVAEAHTLLVHHEARIYANAELWAMRANAAQRLGLHQDSVQSYMQALQTRPNEQRWLLGMAVSLAAMGQTEAANDVAERARTQGPIPREIADYLRQLGVTLR